MIVLEQVHLFISFLSVSKSIFPFLEFNDLKRHLPRVRVVRFKPASQAQRDQLGDGAIAIIDQIVCSLARYFVGTFDSTFTYRIYEEREILGFGSKMTFNTFCVNFGTHAERCEPNSVWPIAYGVG